MALPTGVQVMSVGLNSPADKAGFEQGFMVTGVEIAAQRPAKEWLFVPAAVLLVIILLVQRRRAKPSERAAPQGA
jgi:hypothetical protein